jgi:hypothetical protein
MSSDQSVGSAFRVLQPASGPDTLDKERHCRRECPRKVKSILALNVFQRQRYLNAQTTVNELLEMGVIPIVNENDTLAVAEIKFGDNDTLSAITAAMAHADFLFLMTDVDCLYDKNPRTNPDARPIQVIEDIDSIRADGKSTRMLLNAPILNMTQCRAPDQP